MPIPAQQWTQAELDEGADEDHEEDDESGEVGSVHFVPDFGPEHTGSPDCWCGPQLDPDEHDFPVWVHRTYH